MKKPSRLLQDNDSHWYLIPDTDAARWEQLLSNYPGWDDESKSADKIRDEVMRLGQYRVDNPSDILIKDWEET